MARRRSSGKKNSVSFEKVPDFLNEKVTSNEKSPLQRRRSSANKEADRRESLVNKLDAKRSEIANDSTRRSSEMARSYGRYEKLKDTPDHLYGLDKRPVSSDEDADIDIGDVSHQHSSINEVNLKGKVNDFFQNHWKGISGLFLMIFIVGLLTSTILQALKTSERIKDAEKQQSSETLRKIEEKVDRLSSVLQELSNYSEESQDKKVATLSEKNVKEIVEAALRRYNADKVGIADFALESSGAQIHDSFHSETYDVGAARVILFGFPLWLDVKSPRVILQPDNSPGNCWAFKGQSGYVVIKLSKIITPTAFTLEHIPKVLSPTIDRTIPSAPKLFQVLGWKDDSGKEKLLYGNYEFNNDDDFLQTFKVQNIKDLIPVQYIEFQVLSNHGNKEYTCVYRFRVHGNPQ